MPHNIPIDRVRRREETGREPFESDKQKFTEKQAKLDRLAPNEALSPMTEEEFLEHASNTLSESEPGTTEEDSGR